MSYRVLAYYKLVRVDDPAELMRSHKKFFDGRDVSGRIYISEEGINGQMSGAFGDAADYIDWLHRDPRFADMEFKEQEWHENAFPRMTVKVRRHLVGIDGELDLTKQATHVSPKQWREMLESGEEFLKIDVRNDYEWEIGHFDGFERPEAKTFRDFPAYLQKLAERCDPKKTKVMMCCTGGIRCEFYSPMVKEAGFEQVYQLQGGIIKYAAEEQGRHWKGKLFVFDDRLGVEVNPNDDEVIGRCCHCETPADRLFNCANVECNELFISCEECLHQWKGCCQTDCTEAPRMRDYRDGVGKPFRRLHLLQ